MRKQQDGMIIFDLDGTLTKPVLDFDQIRREMGILEGPILEAIDEMGELQRQKALDILHEHEHQAAHHSQLHEGVRDTIDTLRQQGWPVAILTRNAAKWMHVVLDKHEITVDAYSTRDDGVVKPSPQPILNLCMKTKSNPRKSWMVGDHLFDIQSGRDAGCTTILMIGHNPTPEYASQADHVIKSIPAIVQLVNNE